MHSVLLQCLFEVSDLPKDCSNGSPIRADHVEHIAGRVPCDSAEDNTNQQKCCQPWLPATDAGSAELEDMKMVTHETSETGVAVLLNGEQCSSISTTPAGESSERLLLDGSCMPALCESSSERQPVIASELASVVTTVEEPESVRHGPVEAMHEGVESGDSAFLIANEVLNSSGEADIKEGGVTIEVPVKTDTLSNDDGQEIKAQRPQREQARRRRNEKAFLYDENLVDLILAEHEALLPVGKGHSKPSKGDKVRMNNSSSFV